MRIECTECKQLFNATQYGPERCWTCRTIPPQYRYSDEELYIQKMIKQGCNGPAITKALASNRSLYMVGGCGTGKTRTAWIVANRCNEAGKQVMALDSTKRTFEEVARELLWPGLKPWELKKLKQSLIKVPVLFIDDLGAGKNYDGFFDVLLQIIDARAAGDLITIITANNKVIEKNAHGTTRDRLLRRLKEFYDPITF